VNVVVRWWCGAGAVLVWCGAGALALLTISAASHEFLWGVCKIDEGESLEEFSEE
jgi:hypothetical protein